MAHSKEVRIFACYALFPYVCRASMEMGPYMALAQCLRARSCRLALVLRKDGVQKGEFDLRTCLSIEDCAHYAFSGNRSKTYPSISDFSYSSVGSSDGHSGAGYCLASGKPWESSDSVRPG